MTDWLDPDNLPPIEELDEIPSPEELGYKVLEDPYVDVTGFEYVRGDSAELTGVLQKAMFDVILRNPLDEETADYEVEEQFSVLSGEAQQAIKEGLMKDATRDNIEKIVDQVYVDTIEGKYDPILACRGPSVKAVENLSEEYESPTAAARAGHFTNRFFDSVNIQGGDDVYYVYVNSTGYNHNGRKLPEDIKYVGIVEGMEPPGAEVRCKDCGHEWSENNWGIRIQNNSECGECGYSMEDTPKGEDPFNVDGCFADWDQIADKAVKSKARKTLKHIGWDDICDTLGEQDTFAAFA